MGSLTSRQEGTTEELDPEHVHSYKYPPKSGEFLSLIAADFQGQLIKQSYCISEFNIVFLVSLRYVRLLSL